MKTIRFLILLVTLAAVPQNAQSPAAATSLSPAAYEHVFRHIAFIKARSAALAAEKKPSNLGEYYKDLAGLSQAETNSMNSIALAAVAELKGLDEQAKAIIIQIKGSLTPGKKPPVPPGQLVALQARRDALLAKHHGNLSLAPGAVTLRRLDQALIAKKNGGGK